MERIIKIGLAILLLLCLAKMPYGFYQLVRFTSLVGFAILAFVSMQKNKQIDTLVYIALAILFQPLLKISLGRTIWNIVDVIVAIWLLLSLLSEKKEKSS